MAGPAAGSVPSGSGPLAGARERPRATGQLGEKKSTPRACRADISTILPVREPRRSDGDASQARSRLPFLLSPRPDVEMHVAVAKEPDRSVKRITWNSAGIHRIRSREAARSPVRSWSSASPSHVSTRRRLSRSTAGPRLRRLGIQQVTGDIAQRHPDWPRFRVGVNTGEAVVGLLGTSGGRTFTAIGDAVNLAARLEGAPPVGGVVIGAETARQLLHARSCASSQLSTKEMYLADFKLYELGRREESRRPAAIRAKGPAPRSVSPRLQPVFLQSAWRARAAQAL
jgi:hypothetical protein